MAGYQDNGKEKNSFDWKQFLLLNYQKAGKVCLFALVVTLLFGGIYFLEKEVLGKQEIYRSAAMYQITFDREQVDNIHDYYNDYTWNDVLDSDRIAGVVAAKLGLEKEAVAKAVSIPTMSDIRFIWVYAEADSKETAEAIRSAVGEALYQFAEETDGFRQIEIWDERETEAVEDHLLLGRYMTAAFLMAFFAGFWWIWYQNAMDDSVYTETDLERRFGLPAAGVLLTGSESIEKSEETLKKNLDFLLKDKNRVAVVPAYEGAVSAESVAKVKALLSGKKILDFDGEIREKESALPEAVVLLVPFGKKDGARLEKSCKDLRLLGVEPEAAILTDVNDAFYQRYYFGGKRKK